MLGGYECLLAAEVSVLAVLAFYLYLIAFAKLTISLPILIGNGVFATVFLLILVSNGLIRIFTMSRQNGLKTYILLAIFWWLPVVNVILLKKVCRTTVKEYRYELKKSERNRNRETAQVCATKYPILLVHGIFFRDWKAFNYWGRIPKALIENGATIFYGEQQSTAAVPVSAAEIRDSILKIIKETGAEKVNIIAHSKGGIDSRYAISVLGMDKYVASLTTINTPHFGCNYARKLMDKIPDKAVAAIGNKYEKLFTKLGDTEPDFMSGLVDLTDVACAQLNEIAPNMPNVLYQSIGSQMKSRSAAGFPLNLGYMIIKPMEGENDGLVATTSMPWGNYLGLVTTTGKQGISHGDVIDLTRKNIDGFDVCEFYVDLVSKLKRQGF
ncbi:alpha/beta hydrolase [Lactococcus hodotermopsidis]|uniref:Alpha/beta hydrolase n=2 Tax=Pseudolactococcus hodotermopsidis TaxID=2709157 RepID=A0A6A0BAB6_9LACT|nr:alpha/beta hydrolase [Lactococcus hodotermopsidis]